jgi:cholesterol transport system auxiliary component
MIRVALLSTAISLVLAGCSNLLHSDAQPTQIYILRATAAAAETKATGAAEATRASDGSPAAPSLQIPRPSADPGLATQLITLVRSDHRMDYYLGSRWASDLPDLLETLAIDTLRSSGAWGAVHESPSPFLADYLLQINIRRFEADYTSGKSAPRVYVVLDCTVAKRIGRDLVASFSAEGEADAAENRLSSVVTAFEQAANAALTTMADRSAAVARTVPPTASAP